MSDRLIPYYMNEKGIAKLGDVVSGPGNVRGRIVAIRGTFVKVVGIGEDPETGETVVRPWVTDCPASECVLQEHLRIVLAEK